jgi:adenylate cyclase
MPNKNGVLKPHAYKTTSQENRFIISKTLVRYLQKNKKGIISTDAIADDLLNGAESIIKKGTRSTIAVPILDQAHMIGIIILESSTAVSAYNKKDLFLLTNIANQTSQFIKTSEMSKKIKEDTITRKRFQRLLSPNLAEMVVSGQLKVEKGGESRVATVLFADIRDFTLLSENTNATEVLRMLNDYFEIIVDIVFHHEGTVDKFIGDSMMAIWGAPVDHGDDPIRAVKAAIDIQHLLVEFNKTRAAEGQFQIQTGIGINTGNLVAGYIGSSRTMSYSVIGKTVNTAHRLCSAAKPGQILISGQTLDQLHNTFDIAELEPIPAKGKYSPVRTFNVLNLRP